MTNCQRSTNFARSIKSIAISRYIGINSGHKSYSQFKDPIIALKSKSNKTSHRRTFNISPSPFSTSAGVRARAPRRTNSRKERRKLSANSRILPPLPQKHFSSFNSDNRSLIFTGTSHPRLSVSSSGATLHFSAWPRQIE